MANKTPAPETFDLAAALAGRTYPEETIPVYFDDAKMYALSKLLVKQSNDPANQDLEDEVVGMMAEFRTEQYTVKVRGVDPSLVEEVLDTLNESHPLKMDAFNRPIPNAERGRVFREKLWGLYVVEIKDPEGRIIVAPSDEQLEMFRGKAPDAASAAVDEAIEVLRGGPSVAYKETVSNLAFLSKP